MCNDYLDMLEPFEGDHIVMRHATQLSVTANGLVSAFLRCGADKARVRWKETGYGIDEMYRALTNVCRRKDWKNRCRVSRCLDDIVLIRKREG